MNKKGFTLAEMLIVIAILTLIILSVFPNITGMLKKIDSDKYQRFLSDVFLASEAYIQANISEYPNIKEKNKKVYVYFDDLVNSGYLKSTVYDNKNKKAVKNEDFTVEVYLNDNNEYSYKLYEKHIDLGPLYVAPLSTDTHKGIIYLDPTDLSKLCDASNSVSATETKTGCMKWYVYDDSGNNYKMILDHNTTANIAYNGSGNNSAPDAAFTNQLNADITGWDASLSPRLIKAQEVVKITGAENYWKIDDFSTHYYFDTKTGTRDNTINSKGASNYAWLFDNTSECELYGCNNNDITNLNNHGYLTDTLVSSGSFVWSVVREGFFDYYYVGSTYRGIRPVITISKDIIKNSKCDVGATFNFDYTGSEQTFKVPCSGKYKIEAWGAQGNYGGKDNTPSSQAGKGAYTVGSIELNRENKLYIYVGENNHTNDYSIENATFNGGGSSISKQNNIGYYGGAGGGATDIRLVDGNWNNSDSLNSRIMVAAGGGGGSSSIRDGSSITVHSTKGGAGGNLMGQNASGIYRSSAVSSTYLAKGGTQISGGTIGSYSSSYGIPSVGLFGIGGTSSTPSSANGNYSQGGGGGGWYGGAGGSHYQNVAMSGGAGGSSYISGHIGCVANISATNSAPKNGCTNGTTDIECSKHYSGYVFTDTNMISGNEIMPTHDGTSTMIGNSNSGYARITYLGK